MEIQGEEIKLQFLVSGSYGALPSSYLKLRSYLNIHSSNLAKLHGLKLPKCFTKKQLTCTQCFLPWSYESCSMKLLPVKRRKKRFSKTKVNSKLKVLRNQLVLKCKICSSNSYFSLPKIAKTAKTAKTVKLVPQDDRRDEGKKKKKKKKKKDKMSGLRKSLNVPLKNVEPLKGKNKIKSSVSNTNKSANPAANINGNVKQVNLKIQNSLSVPRSQAKKGKKPVTKRSLGISQRGGKLQGKPSTKKNKNLLKLKKLVQTQEQPVKKTLKDFLTLI